MCLSAVAEEHHCICVCVDFVSTLLQSSFSFAGNILTHQRKGIRSTDIGSIIFLSSTAKDNSQSVSSSKPPIRIDFEESGILEKQQQQASLVFDLFIDTPQQHWLSLIAIHQFNNDKHHLKTIDSNYFRKINKDEFSAESFGWHPRIDSGFETGTIRIHCHRASYAN